jgi:hypothetical protein
LPINVEPWYHFKVSGALHDVPDKVIEDPIHIESLEILIVGPDGVVTTVTVAIAELEL